MLVGERAKRARHYLEVRTSFSARASNYVKWGELSGGHFYSSHWKRTLNLFFKGSGCFQFPEAVITSTAKESLRPTERGSLQVLAVIWE